MRYVQLQHERSSSWKKFFFERFGHINVNRNEFIFIVLDKQIGVIFCFTNDIDKFFVKTFRMFDKYTQT